MHPLGWAVILTYAGAVLGIGWLTSRRQSGTEEYFRGSRRLPWWALGISIIATAFSAASLLGGPGGGYVLSTACSVPPGAPPENVRQLGAAALAAGG